MLLLQHLLRIRSTTEAAESRSDPPAQSKIFQKLRSRRLFVMSNSSKKKPNKAFTWRRLVRLSGPEAEAWVDDYEQHLDLIELSSRALGFCHRKQFDDGAACLEEMETGLESRPDMRPSVRSVILRYLYGVRGYLHYCRAQWDEASVAMHAANRAVVDAVEEAPFLLPLADACHEFCLHHARIARNQRRWRDMFARIMDVRRMMACEAPLCVLSDGRRVDYDTLTAHYETLGELDPAEQEEIAPMLTKQGRMELLDSFVRRMLALPNFAIQYP